MFIIASSLLVLLCYREVLSKRTKRGILSISSLPHRAFRYSSLNAIYMVVRSKP
jgi:hypothetical protein